jgi:hypothetical protein
VCAISTTCITINIYTISKITNATIYALHSKYPKDINQLNTHIKVIEKKKMELKDDIRTLELKNWINYIKV